MIVNAIATNAVGCVCVYSHRHCSSPCLHVASKAMRAHSGAAAHAGLQRCDAVSPSKQSVTFQRIIVSVYSGSNHKLLDLEDEGTAILKNISNHSPNDKVSRL